MTSPGNIPSGKQGDFHRLSLLHLPRYFSSLVCSRFEWASALPFTLDVPALPP